MIIYGLFYPAAVFALWACAQSPAPPQAPDASLPQSQDNSPPAQDSPNTAANYCEVMAESFCGFYLRCGRMDVPDQQSCLSLFSESCEEQYEPLYRGLEAAGLLSLSASGVVACQEHLGEVACADHPRDLDGPCASMWVGKQPSDAACAFGLESLVCQAGNTCQLGFSLCGSCVPTVSLGEGCDSERRCAAGSTCEDGICVPRGAPGEACGDGLLCDVGLSCEQGFCRGPSYGGPGAACGSYLERCAYKSQCVDGLCVAAGRLGDSCSDSSPCAVGYCRGGQCAPLKSAQEACAYSFECRNQRCIDGQCGAWPSSCF